ncbi:hypothetical protein [Roseivirga seohaensis]|uniref:Uncharacterized protein n=2 Tax=Roseivirga seohaensis TaxID=1914963 RepID=A0A0L8ANU5_9BACT|nr:hypothetical protein [Roseivirga seohaensis]KOF03900.1 hypothetical protein OB69_02490 [Roseivirga seohaensis subsp. aquiponti]KYG85383.1 hypothetical protein AWW67_15440 [Roseivirga seohaensis]|tara:strand:- start:508 stop:906 length:399 start_codon:yes stop_codon:yes gene_type:complete
MKKDISFPEVTGVKIAIAKSTNNLGESEWHAYIINKNLIELNDVLVVSKGQEKPNGTGRNTSTLRHILETIEAQSTAPFEMISPEVFSFQNEFWISYYIVGELFDKKFIIAPFNEFELQDIEELGLKGVYAQ